MSFHSDGIKKNIFEKLDWLHKKENFFLVGNNKKILIATLDNFARNLGFETKMLKRALPTALEYSNQVVIMLYGVCRGSRKLLFHGFIKTWLIPLIQWKKFELLDKL